MLPLVNEFDKCYTNLLLDPDVWTLPEASAMVFDTIAVKLQPLMVEKNDATSIFMTTDSKNNQSSGN